MIVENGRASLGWRSWIQSSAKPLIRQSDLRYPTGHGRGHSYAAGRNSDSLPSDRRFFGARVGGRPPQRAGCIGGGQGFWHSGHSGMAGRGCADEVAAPAWSIWGVSVTEAEALRFLQAGARGYSCGGRPLSRGAYRACERGGKPKLDGRLAFPRYYPGRTAIPEAS